MSHAILEKYFQLLSRGVLFARLVDSVPFSDLGNTELLLRATVCDKFVSKLLLPIPRLPDVSKSHSNYRTGFILRKVPSGITVCKSYPVSCLGVRYGHSRARYQAFRH